MSVLFEARISLRPRVKGQTNCAQIFGQSRAAKSPYTQKRAFDGQWDERIHIFIYTYIYIYARAKIGNSRESFYG